MDERLKMAAFAFLAAACTAGVWMMQTGPKSASAASADPVSEEQKLELRIRNEVAKQLPAAVEAEVKHQVDILSRAAEEKKQQAEELARKEAEKWAPAAQAVNDLQSVRFALALYRVQHHDTWPTLAAIQNWQILLAATNSSGNAITPGSKDVSFGPYLQVAPVNLFNEKSSVVPAGHAIADAGWTYDANTGVLRIIVPTGQLERAKPLNGDFEVAP